MEICAIPKLLIVLKGKMQLIYRFDLTFEGYYVIETWSFLDWSIFMD